MLAMVAGFTGIMSFLPDEQCMGTEAGTDAVVCIARSTRGATKSKAQLQAVGLLIVHHSWLNDTCFIKTYYIIAPVAP